jgi:hypothetical protein
MRNPAQAFRTLLLLSVPCLLIDYAMWCGLCRLASWATHLLF